jgi:hypothetical protein
MPTRRSTGLDRKKVPRSAVSARAAVPAALALATLGVAAPARAQVAAAAEPARRELGLAIRWQGPEDCQRGEAVQAKVLRLLGGSKRAVGERFEVSVTVRRGASSRYVAELETSSASGGGTKRLEGESCDAIALASSVVIALSIDPQASLDAQEPLTEPEHEREPEPEPEQRHHAPPARREPLERRATSPYLHGSVGVLFGLLGEPTAFSQAGVGLRHHLVSIELAFGLHRTHDVLTAARPRAGAALRLYTFDLLACYAPLRSPLGSLAACMGGRLEHLTARAFGVSNPDQGTVLILAGLGVLRWRLRATSWLSATLDGGVSVQPFHPTFVLLGVGDVLDIPVVSSLARTGLTLEF